MSLPLLVSPSEISAWIMLAVTIIGAALKIWAMFTENEKTKSKLGKAEKVVGAIGEAINTVTPKLGADNAHELKTKVNEAAARNSVLGELDELVERFGLNKQPTAELADPQQP